MCTTWKITNCFSRRRGSARPVLVHDYNRDCDLLLALGRWWILLSVRFLLGPYKVNCALYRLTGHIGILWWCIFVQISHFCPPKVHVTTIDLTFCLLRSILMDTKQPCYQHRSVCYYCQQSLGYTALRCHRDLPHLYCPGCIKTAKKPRLDSSDSDSSDSTFVPMNPPLKLLSPLKAVQKKIFTSLPLQVQMTCRNLMTVSLVLRFGMMQVIIALRMNEMQ